MTITVFVMDDGHRSYRVRGPTSDDAKNVSSILAADELARVGDRAGSCTFTFTCPYPYPVPGGYEAKGSWEENSCAG